MESKTGVAATATLVCALVARLVSDRRHNKRIEARQQAVAAKELDKARDATEEPVSELEGSATGLQWPAAVFTACTVLVLVWQGAGAQLPSQVITTAIVMSLTTLLIALIARFWPKASPEAKAEERQQCDRPQVRESLTGTWIKDKRASEDMGPAIQLAELNRLTRTAVKLIKGIQIIDSEATFEMAVFSVIGWFKVREIYPFTSELCRQKRRDLRRGHHKGRVKVTDEGHVRLEFEWPEPVAGRGFDEFRLVARNELHVRSRMEVGERVAAYTTVYRKR